METVNRKEMDVIERYYSCCHPKKLIPVAALLALELHPQLRFAYKKCLSCPEPNWVVDVPLSSSCLSYKAGHCKEKWDVYCRKLRIQIDDAGKIKAPKIGRQTKNKVQEEERGKERGKEEKEEKYKTFSSCFFYGWICSPKCEKEVSAMFLSYRTHLCANCSKKIISPKD